MTRFGKAGQRLAEQLGEYFDSQDLELTPHERALVTEICLTVDRLDLCAKMIAISPIEYNSEGQKMKDWMTEERNQRLVLARLIKSANLSTEIVDAFAHGAKPWSSRRSENKARKQGGAA
ncbi:hypothetical protein [Glycomyces sp. NPDC021274]|uniref:hypothetical protein n=1 Tax=Glycomyces sp. NPDC021274 TaxID=3155120 RepID=UPI0033F89A79